MYPLDKLPIPEANHAQKNPTKKKASESKNNLKPIFKPRATIEVWQPKYVASETMSIIQE